VSRVPQALATADTPLWKLLSQENQTWVMLLEEEVSITEIPL
jgi:hypothetical protein